MLVDLLDSHQTFELNDTLEIEICHIKAIVTNDVKVNVIIGLKISSTVGDDFVFSFDKIRLSQKYIVFLFSKYHQVGNCHL